MKKSRRPTLAPLYALGISFVLVLVLGTVLPREASPQPASHSPSGNPAPLIEVTVEGSPAAAQSDEHQKFHIQIVAKDARPEDAPYQEWSLPIPSITLVQEKIMDKRVCLSGPKGWTVKKPPIPADDIPVDDNPDENSRRCTKTVSDPQRAKISFTVSTN